MENKTCKVIAFSIDPVHIRYLCTNGCTNPKWKRKQVLHQHGSCGEAHNRIESRLCDNCPFYTGNIDIHITEATIREKFVLKRKEDCVVSFD